jgi:hypothetical protein
MYVKMAIIDKTVDNKYPPEGVIFRFARQPQFPTSLDQEEANDLSVPSPQECSNLLTQYPEPTLRRQCAAI